MTPAYCATRDVHAARTVCDELFVPNRCVHCFYLWMDFKMTINKTNRYKDIEHGHTHTHACCLLWFGDLTAVIINVCFWLVNQCVLMVSMSTIRQIVYSYNQQNIKRAFWCIANVQFKVELYSLVLNGVWVVVLCVTFTSTKLVILCVSIFFSLVMIRLVSAPFYALFPFQLLLW